MNQPLLSDAPNRPIQLIAKELAASSGYLLARLGLAFKSQAMARAEESGFELYDYSVLAILSEGDRETQATIADALSVDPSKLVGIVFNGFDNLGGSRYGRHYAGYYATPETDPEEAERSGAFTRISRKVGSMLRRGEEAAVRNRPSRDRSLRASPDSRAGPRYPVDV